MKLRDIRYFMITLLHMVVSLTWSQLLLCSLFSLILVSTGSIVMNTILPSTSGFTRYNQRFTILLMIRHRMVFFCIPCVSKNVTQCPGPYWPSFIFLAPPQMDRAHPICFARIPPAWWLPPIYSIPFVCLRHSYEQMVVHSHVHFCQLLDGYDSWW